MRKRGKREERIFKAHYQHTVLGFFYIVINELHSFPFIIKLLAIIQSHFQLHHDVVPYMPEMISAS